MSSFSRIASGDVRSLENFDPQITACYTWKIATEATTTPPAGDADEPAEHMFRSARFFSKVAESLRKSQVAANNAQIHILRQREEIQRFMENHSSSVSSQEFNQCNEEIAT